MQLFDKPNYNLVKLNYYSTTGCIVCFKAIKNMNRFNKGDVLNKHGERYQ